MITVSKLGNAGAALAYYSERDDYYREGGSAPAVFFGRGAEQLGMLGALDTRRKAERFANVLIGKADGKTKHTPGYDVTFSAPKSISVAALVKGDARLVVAHDHAVSAALAHIEQHAIVTRQRGADGVGYQWRHGDGMVAAVFRHTTSREQDPQLHSHSVIANTTRDPATNAWRALDSREIYRIQREAGAIYTTELAAASRTLGYGIDWKVTIEGHPTFELTDVPEAVRIHFSSRSTQVEAALAAKGLTRESASSAAKQAAALDTRAEKESVDHALLAAGWLAEALAMGYEVDSAPTSQPRSDTTLYRLAAEAAVLQASAHLSERDARFSARSLAHETALFCQGHATGEQVRVAVVALTAQGQLEPRDVSVRAAGGRREPSAGFTTRTGIETETNLLLAARRLNDRGTYIGPTFATEGHRQRDATAAIRTQESKTGREFTPEQRDAAATILTSAKALYVLHGHAGTAKTSSVLAAISGAALSQGFTVRAIAPTNYAAAKLGDSLNEKGATVASVLLERVNTSALVIRDTDKRALWLVDEAGMIGAKDMQLLLEKADRENAVVILAGDTKQLGSVEAGAAFEQIRDHFGSIDLTEIKRQTNDVLREAVYDAERGDARAALAKVPSAELPTRVARVAEITRLYIAHPAKQRRDTLVLAPGKDDRAEINAAIREARRAAGELGRETTVTALVKSDMTRAQQRDAARFQPGMIVEAGRRFQRGPEKGERVEVIGIDKGKVITRMADGLEWRFNPKTTAAIRVYDGATVFPVAEGDRLIARGPITAQTKSGIEPTRIANGTVLYVVLVTDEAIHVRDQENRELTIGRTAQVDYGYAQTVHQAQGQDYARVIAHAESSRENLSSIASMYVAISRAREDAIVVTDSRNKLTDTLNGNRGRNSTALQPGLPPYPLGQLAEHQREQSQSPTQDPAAPTRLSVAIEQRDKPEIESTGPE